MTSVVSWQPVYPIFLYAVLALAGVAVLATARRMAISPRMGTWVVLGPRLLVLGLLIVILLNPIERRETHLPPRP
ncbi:MAG: hypothetical protein KDA55_00540, partial [Planctomycetales bacterium]|nr:hypothetical protein [Planctomycetales bacterium]